MKDLKLHDIFLNHLRRNKTPVRVELADRIAISGTIRGFDNEVIIICSGGYQHMVYKRSIIRIITDEEIIKPQTEAASCKA